MSTEANKAVVACWFDRFWGKDFDPGVIDELAAPDIRFEYSLHAPVRGRDEVREFATPVGSLPAGTGKTMRLTGITVLRVENGLIAEEVGLDDGLTALRQLGLITGA